MKPGQYFSWIVVDNETMVKVADQSVYKYNLTLVPIDLRDYWDCRGMKEGESKKVWLEYQGGREEATLEYHYREGSSYTQIRWKAPLAKYLKRCNPNWESEPSLLFMEFEKKSDNCFALYCSLAKNESEMDVHDDLMPDDSNAYLVTEGNKKRIVTNRYERNPALRKKCIEKNGTFCSVCGFDFSKVYGSLGEGYIEVHHISPLYLQENAMPIDPEKDLVPVCANCHRMFHRRRNIILSLEEMRRIISGEGSGQLCRKILTIIIDKKHRQTGAFYFYGQINIPSRVNIHSGSP